MESPALPGTQIDASKVLSNKAQLATLIRGEKVVVALSSRGGGEYVLWQVRTQQGMERAMEESKAVFAVVKLRDWKELVSSIDPDRWREHEEQVEARRRGAITIRLDHNPLQIKARR